MDFAAQVESDYIAALKGGNELTVAVLRMLKTAAKNAQVALRRPLVEQEWLDVVAKQIKQRHESVEMFRKAGRNEMADREEREAAVLAAYMPVQLSEAELRDALDRVVAELKPQGLKDMGRVMQALMAAHKGRVDGKRASDAVKAHLSR